MSAEHPTPESAPARRPRRPALEPFDVVVERHGPAVLRFCVARMGADRGEECFQETLLAALRAYDELRDPGAVAGWLFRIAHRKIVDAARAAERAPVLAGEAIEGHLAPWHDPEPGASGVWAHVAALPPKQREAVALRYVADLPHADVAAVMGTSVEAARRNVFEGLRRLRDEVGS